MPENLLAPPTMFFLMVIILGVVSTVGYYWHAARSAELAAGVKRDELALKTELVKAGMSADEIVRVVGTEAGKAAEVSEPAGV